MARKGRDLRTTLHRPHLAVDVLIAQCFAVRVLLSPVGEVLEHRSMLVDDLLGFSELLSHESLLILKIYDLLSIADGY